MSPPIRVNRVQQVSDFENASAGREGTGPSTGAQPRADVLRHPHRQPVARLERQAAMSELARQVLAEQGLPLRAHRAPESALPVGDREPVALFVLEFRHPFGDAEFGVVGNTLEQIRRENDKRASAGAGDVHDVRQWGESMSDRLLTAAELAQALAMSPATILDWAQAR